MRPSNPKKVYKKQAEIVYLNSGALSQGLWRTLWCTCHLMGVELSDRLFGQNKLCLSQHFIYVYVCFVRNVAISQWLASVWLIISCDYSDWMTAITMNADRSLMDYMAHICMIIIYITTHQCVITDYYQQFVWMSGNISVCLAIRLSTWVCTTYKTIFFSFFIFITQIILIVCFSGQIKHLYMMSKILSIIIL